VYHSTALAPTLMHPFHHPNLYNEGPSRRFSVLTAAVSESEHAGPSCSLARKLRVQLVRFVHSSRASHIIDRLTSIVYSSTTLVSIWIHPCHIQNSVSLLPFHIAKGTGFLPMEQVSPSLVSVLLPHPPQSHNLIPPRPSSRPPTHPRLTS
jgi:hypothetical protein